ncbi:uncharacterized protein TRUGW13939_00866 [Talaromyces rugulosus]|uniref:Uncharacterized protein n=1 Tax=Talaromyces rugulosus TaxID=121627 RepID=A0A7H8QIR2_TALRU|nr:uncharacterized protein TRUGW13939_00866 [Talaromyces rugulosus]QKX53786.1 hypothetical protein TRUGW13939_00866 [Talaromyces rugulosus]
MTTSDIGQLWSKALEDYKDETNINLEDKHDIFKGVRIRWGKEEVVDAAEPVRGPGQPQKKLADLAQYLIEESTQFKKARHDNKKLDKARSLIFRMANPLKLLATTASNSADAACPAAPVILVVFTEIIGACVKVSEQFDSIEGLYLVIHSFVDRLQLLEGSLPAKPVYQKQVTMTFSAILKFCGKTHTYMTGTGTGRHLHRMKTWFKALINGKDPVLKATYDEVIRCIAGLDSATIMVTLTSVIDMKTNLNNQRTLIEETLGGISSIVISTEKNHHKMEQREKDDNKFQQEALRLLRRLDSPANVDPMERKSQALEIVTQVLAVGVENLVQQRLKELEQSYVAHTFDWITDTEGYRSFMSKDVRILFIRGDSGMGKSMFSYYFYDTLLKYFEHDAATSVAYFPFDDEVESLQSVKNMLCYCAAQVARKDSTYVDEILGVIRRDSNADYRGENCWERLFGGRFNWRQRRLVMILDGFDQLPEEEQSGLITYLTDATLQLSKEKQTTKLRKDLEEAVSDKLSEEQKTQLVNEFVEELSGTTSEKERTQLVIEFVKKLPNATSEEKQKLTKCFPDTLSRKLSIQFILTATPKPQLDSLEATMIDLNQERITDLDRKRMRKEMRKDIREVAQARVETLPKLSTFRRGMKTRIVQLMDENADSFLYVDHTLRRFNQIGSASVISNSLGSWPDNTIELCNKLFLECLDGETEAYKTALTRLFCWLAYSKRLSLGAAARLLALSRPPTPERVIEQEVDGRLSRVFSVLDHYDENDHDIYTTDDDTQSHHESGTSSEKVKGLLGFRERSFKTYFRELFEQHPADRYPGLSKHDVYVMMFEMSADILVMHPTAGADGVYNDAEEELISYASKSFLEYLLALQDVSAEEVGPVLNRLLRALANDNGALTKLEDIVDPYEDHGPYSIFGVDVKEPLKVLKKLAGLAPNITQTAEDNTLFEGIEWAKTNLGDGHVVLKNIALKHINNWFEAEDAPLAFTSFRFAHQALCDLSAVYFTDLTARARTDSLLNKLGITEDINAGSVEGVVKFWFAHQVLCELSTECFTDLIPTARTDSLLKKLGINKDITARSVEGDANFWFTHQELCDLSADCFTDFIASSGNDSLLEKLDITKDITAESAEEAPKFRFQKRIAHIHKQISLVLFFVDNPSKALNHAQLGLGKAESPEDKFQLSYRIARTKFSVWKHIFKPEDKSFIELEAAHKSYSLVDANENGVSTFDVAEVNDDVSDLDIAKVRVSAIDAAIEVKRLFENALGIHKPKIEKLDSDLMFTVNGAYQMKALLETLTVSRETANAVESMAKAMEVRTSDTYVRFFNNLIEGFSEKRMWREINELLEILYNDNPFEDGLWEITHRAIQRAAKAGKPEDRDRVKRLYQQATPSQLDGAESKILEISLWFAKFQWLVLNDPAPAKKLTQRIFNVSRDGLQWVGESSRQLADILTEEFRTSCDPNGKQKTLKEMEELIEVTKQRHGPEFQAERAHTRIPLAIMRQKMGPADIFFKDLKDTFDGCLKALKDDRSDNDPFSFRMLAKTLSLVPNMNKEFAKVSLSCQFSIVDRDLYEKEQEEQKDNDNKDTYWSIQCHSCGKSTSGFEDTKYYLCYYCANCDLCGECYERRKTEELPADWIQVCPIGHDHIEAPVDEWDGIHSGCIKYGGKKIRFEDWLETLKMEWKKCWDQYWQ